jgi:hypothetical protein
MKKQARPFPMDRDEIKQIKLFYRKEFLEWMMANRDDGRRIMAALEIRGYANPKIRKNLRNTIYRTNYRLRHPEKYKAEKEIAKARHHGQLNPEPCFNCGSTNGVEAHHEDYSKPLDIVWLCRECHVGLHNNKITIGVSQ